jgi:DnaJ-class molecular chaperone
MSFYEILEVPETASIEEIKKSYRKLSLKYHPDRHPPHLKDEMSEKFKKISEAYEVLGDEQRKEEHDMMNKNPFVKMMGNPNDMGNIDELFSSLFGMSFGGGHPMGGMGGMGGHHMGPMGMGMGGPMGMMNMGPMGMGPMGGPNIRIFRNGQPINMNQQLQKPTPIIQTIVINMEHVLDGATLPVDIERWLIENETKMFEHETLYVTIPKGVDDNEIIILRDKGNIISDQCRGDVKLFIKIENNTNFERNGLDLLTHKYISLKESLCGFSFDLKYINDKTFTINNNGGNIIQPEYKKVIPKLGLTRDNHVGNLIIFFHVQFPEKLEQSVIEQLKNIL